MPCIATGILVGHASACLVLIFASSTGKPDRLKPVLLVLLPRPWCMIRRNKPHHAPIPRAADNADGQSAPNHYRRGSGRHARVLRLLPDRLRRGLHRRSMEAHLWRIRGDSVVLG